MALLMVFYLISNLSSCNVSEVSRSTVEREKLPSSAVKETAYYTDADGSWIYSPGTLERGMRAFYESTGVRPIFTSCPTAPPPLLRSCPAKRRSCTTSCLPMKGIFSWCSVMTVTAPSTAVIP